MVKSISDAYNIDPTGNAAGNLTQTPGSLVPNSGVDTTGPAEINTPSSPTQPLARGFSGSRSNITDEGTAFKNMPFITVSPVAGLNAERFLVAGSGISILDNGPNNSLILSVNDSSLQLVGSTNIETSGLFVGSRPTLNFLQEGTIRLTATDDAINNRIDITLSAFIDVGVSSITLSAGAGILIENSTVTSAGTIDIRLTETGITAGEYNLVEVDQYGRIFSGQIVEYITESSANAAYVAQGDLSALSQFTNDQGFVSAAQFTGGGIIDITVSGSEIRVSASQATFSTFVELKSLDIGATVIANVSGGDEINQRTIIGTGGIEITETATQIIISARSTPINVSELVNDIGFITATSTQTLIDNLSALSLFTNDVGFISEIQVSSFGIGNSVVINVSSNEIQFKTIVANGGIELIDNGNELVLSARPAPTLFSELTNDLNLISEPSALALLANLSVLSQFIDDVGYATLTYVDTTFVFAGELSALSQFGNDQGFVSAAQFIGGGNITVNVSGTGPNLEIRISANNGGFSEASAVSLIESYGFITETSAIDAFIAQGDLSALSQFDNDVGYITEASALALVVPVDISALSQLTNDVGYITETSALALVVPVDISALSQLTNDVGYITETSAVALIAAISASDVSALSQLTNDAGFVNQVSALGGGETVYIGASATELQFKTFTGGGSVDVTTSGNTIKISAAQSILGGLITVEDNNVVISSAIDTFNFANQEQHNNGEQIIVSADSNVLTINAYIPKMYSVRVNMANGSNPVIDTTTPLQDLPAGWTFNALEGGSQSTVVINIPAEVQRPPRSVTIVGYTVSTGAHRAFGGTTSVNAEWRDGEPTVLRLNVVTASQAGSSGATGSYVRYELLY